MNERFVVVSLLAIIAVAIALSFFAHEKREYAYIENVDLKLKSVNDSSADITFFVKVNKVDLSGANLSISVYDKYTGILLKRKILKLPDEACELNTTISFEKDRDYRVLFKIEKNGKTISSTGLTLRNLKTLIPKDRELKVFLRDVDFEIKSVEKGSVKVLTRFYIDSLKNYSVRFHIKAVQFESNVLASEKWLDLNITSGKTTIVESTLDVPKNYNYLVKLEAWRNSYLVKSWSRCLNLAPTKKIPKNISEEEVKFEVEKFVKPEVRATPTPVEYAKYTRAVPGFELIICIFALGGALIWRLKRL